MGRKAAKAKADGPLARRPPDRCPMVLTLLILAGLVALQVAWLASA
jgi:hypothetical protein